MIDPTPAIEFVATNPGKVSGAIVAIGGALAHWRSTGKVPVGRLPWRTARQALRELGDQYFGKARPSGVPGLLVDAKPADLEGPLREAHFESTDLYSNEHEGEVLGLRRPSGLRPHPETGAETPMELHPRVFETADGRSWIIAHDEASRLEAWKAHVTGALLSWERGQDRMAGVLDEAGIDYGLAESEQAAGVEVVA